MRTQTALRRQLREIDHKGYKAYKVLEGEYDFGTYRLAIDHVQGDPFATPSRVRIIYNNRGNIAPQDFESRHRNRGGGLSAAASAANPARRQWG